MLDRDGRNACLPAASAPLPLNPARGGSESSFLTNAVALACAIGIGVFCYRSGLTNLGELVPVVLLAEFVLAVLLEAACFPKTSFVSRLRRRRALAWRRVGYRLTALVVTLLAIGCVYWLLPMFSDIDMRKHYYPFLGLLVPLILLLSVPYFCLADVTDEEEEDVFCRIGRALVRRERTVTAAELANYARGWAVKAFWLSLMHPGFVVKIQSIVETNGAALSGSPAKLFLLASACCYAVDLCYTVGGYIFSFKLFNTHIRTAEPTLLGWSAALLCYWPFWAILFEPYFFRYCSNTTNWMTLFAEGSALWWTWAAAILLLEALYASATVAAGVRFSNLTYRGLWDTGPYRWTKHPAYVFKNVSWWLISLPFVLNGGTFAIRGTILLLALNGIYYLRARTEEAHLSHYPEYVAYALRMNERSIFRWCARLLPFLAYRPPDRAGVV